MRSLFWKIFLWFWLAMTLVIAATAFVSYSVRNASDNAPQNARNARWSFVANTSFTQWAQAQSAAWERGNVAPKTPTDDILSWLLDDDSALSTPPEDAEWWIFSTDGTLLSHHNPNAAPTNSKTPNNAQQNNAQQNDVRELARRAATSQRVVVSRPEALSPTESSTGIGNSAIGENALGADIIPDELLATKTRTPKGRNVVFVARLPFPDAIRNAARAKANQTATARRAFPLAFFFLRGEPLTRTLRLLTMIATASLFCFWLARHVTRPMTQLRNAANQLASGQLDARVAPNVTKRRDEMGELGRDFNSMATRLETAMTAQRRLISDVSHELRSPLARLNIALELARRHSQKPQSSTRSERNAQTENTPFGTFAPVVAAQNAFSPQSVSPQSATSQSATSQSATSQTATLQTATLQTATLQTATLQTELAQNAISADSSSTKSLQPNESQLSDSQPNVSQPNVSQPNVSQPNVSQPNVSQPNVSQPNDSNRSAISPGEFSHDATAASVSSPNEALQNEALQKALNRIEREASRLEEMIAQLLKLSRLDGAPPEDQSDFDVLELVREIADDVRFEAIARGCEIVVVAQGIATNEIAANELSTAEMTNSKVATKQTATNEIAIEETQSAAKSRLENASIPTIKMHGSRALLRSALENVLRNAVRFSPPSATVTIEVEHCSEKFSEPQIAIRVLDCGPGAPENALSKLFQPFYRVEDARDRASGGTGLGLAIAERAVHLHGGTIGASNRATGGLCVGIVLPQS